MKEILNNISNHHIRRIANKVVSGTRLKPAEGLLLYTDTDLSLLCWLSGIVRRRINGNSVFFNKNFHIEPTNKCVYNCRFCSYHKPASDPESWEYSHEEMLEIVKRFDNKNVTEVHIVGGVHPLHDLQYYCNLIGKIKNHRPSLHIKAFSAIELDYMIKKAGTTVEEGLEKLKECGLGSIPGGGETAHKTGIPSNATMLYGHIENYAHRIDHMERIRELQDRTGGFNAFIPLKFKKENNIMSYLGEVSIVEDFRNYAVARIYLDNMPHIKAYWPMTGKEVAQLSLLFGTDDIDGTIEDTTRIYSMAGAGEKNPVMTTAEIRKLISEAGFEPVERDSLYNRL
jgi:aminodeoxyfutalosine synthase